MSAGPAEGGGFGAAVAHRERSAADGRGGLLQMGGAGIRGAARTAGRGRHYKDGCPQGRVCARSAHYYTPTDAWLELDTHDTVSGYTGNDPWVNRPV